jgi:hypothetical protein
MVHLGRIFFKKMLLYFELMICDKYRGKNTSPQCVKTRRKNKVLCRTGCQGPEALDGDGSSMPCPGCSAPSIEP